MVPGVAFPRLRDWRLELWAGAVGEGAPVRIGRQMSTWCGASGLGLAPCRIKISPRCLSSSELPTSKKV